MHGDKWIRLNAGDLTLRTWIGDSRVIYRATWDPVGWNVIRHMAGAAQSLMLIAGEPSFHAVQAVVDDDRRGL
ncbi:hypothetical protein [Mycolicibacterium septicum]|uniref:hypothetical protein n=1 Tax=Mycolicibacterium septicum TaxID=98668 RepID=UPI001AF53387|nr:hypothetical protein [Mycolicibacterium septicum]QRY53814.1 hypothetical protein JVX95_11100 [Mycolicibacterium septicum]